jgi:hypothetical protein
MMLPSLPSFLLAFTLSVFPPGCIHPKVHGTMYEYSQTNTAIVYYKDDIKPFLNVDLRRNIGRIKERLREIANADDVEGVYPFSGMIQSKVHGTILDYCEAEYCLIYSTKNKPHSIYLGDDPISINKYLQWASKQDWIEDIYPFFPNLPNLPPF